jgi:hypothetical protein
MLLRKVKAAARKGPGSLRAERMLLDYVPLEYPAVADRRLAECLIKASWEADATCYEGLTLSVRKLLPGEWLRDGRGVLGRDRVGPRASVAEGWRIERGRRNVHRPGDVETLRHARRCTVGHREPSHLRRRILPERTKHARSDRAARTAAISGSASVGRSLVEWCLSLSG